MAFARHLFALILLLAACSGRAAPLKPLSVYFFDVGQGDAALIVSPNGKTVLIDAGPPEADERLVPRVRELVQGPLDLVILTHPHLDHLGGMARVIQTVGAKVFMDPGFNHPSEAYLKLLKVVGKNVEKLRTPIPNLDNPEAPLTINLGEGASLSIFWPRVPQQPFLKDTRSDANSNSIVARLNHGATSFLFTGDAEPETETALLARPVDLRATVLKVAHHGGRYSSTAPFLAAVRPQAAIISCGAGNEYGHPTAEALQRLGAQGARVLRTDRDGEVLAVSDGDRVTFTTRKGSAPPLVISGGPAGPSAPLPVPVDVSPREGPSKTELAAPPPTAGPTRYVGLKGSKVFHREDCATLRRSKTQGRTVYTDRDSALRERRPSEDCKP
ncbi:ComEC/Rec2 family competence protein [Cystobacter ferrugineus]|uniref:MBL fold hydrolase n=1 Tax=Cystobacter ferrugineus TaxID=83449 RepID=A0A1L9AZC2_9BACT|nr:ComEC/Rec2 family competence protein [Cystobacter ferrugineus]OJH35355.1 MBL fold hydrolase [Cystobacter ferrugineus]